MRFNIIILCLMILFLITGCSQKLSLDQSSDVTTPGVAQSVSPMQDIGKIDFSKCLIENTSSQTKNGCITSYFVPKLKNIAVCDQMFELDYNKEYVFALDDKFNCYTDVASETESAIICEQITTASQKNRCLGILADWKKGVSVCDDMNHYNFLQVTEDNINYCYKDFAVHSLNLSLCERIPDVNYSYGRTTTLVMPEPKKICFEEIAVRLKDASICDRFADKDTCYMLVNREIKDPSLCNKILNNKYMKEDCLKDLNN